MNIQKPTVSACKVVSLELAEKNKKILIPLKYLIHIQDFEGVQIVTGFSYYIFASKK